MIGNLSVSKGGNMSDDAGGWFFAITLVIVWAGWNYSWNPLSSEISMYQQIWLCKDYKNEKNCKWKNNSLTTYKINEDTQTVIYWFSGNPWDLRKADSCIVKNRKHWKCGTMYRFGFNDGDYTTSGGSDHYRYISKTSWWWNELYNWFKG